HPAKAHGNHLQPFGRRQTPAQALPEQLGRAVGRAVPRLATHDVAGAGTGRRLRGEPGRLGIVAVSAQDVVGAGEDEARDTAPYGRLEGVDDGVHVRGEEIGPGLLRCGVGGQVDDDVGAAELLDPFGVPDTQVGATDGGVAVRIAVEQAQLVAALQVVPEL